MALGDDIAGPGVTTQGASSGGGTTKIAFTRGSLSYDNPFLDMTSTFLPKSIKGILKFVASYVVGDGLVSQCISKLSEYPITSLIYNEDKKSSLKDDARIEKWKLIFEKKIKINKVLKQAGMDYYAYGNSIISINYPFKRMLTCPKCNCVHSVDGMKVRFKDFSFISECTTKGCGYKGKMKAKDVGTKEIDKLSVVHWDLLFIDIKYNPISGDHFYFYTIPPGLSSMVRRGDMDIINTTRLEVIEAIQSRKQLKLTSDNVFHLKRPAPQYLLPSERGWGISAVMPVMKDIFHNKILKKGNEMIAFDHIVPLRMLFPQGTGDVSPHATINLSGWRTKIEDEIRKWRVDPNHVSIIPIPLGLANFSGDAKMLLITPEIKATEDVIITGMGIIPEIIRGGASWSGSNVSLRVVENTFLNHRIDCMELISFLEENISRYLDLPGVSIKMSDFKMADDLEKKKLMIDLSKSDAANKIVSDTTVSKEMGFDPHEEYKNKEEDLKRSIELAVRQSEGSAEAQGIASIIAASYNAEAQISNRDRLEMHERESQAKRDDSIAAESEENAHSIAQEADAVAAEKGIAPPGSISLPNLILILTERFRRLSEIDRGEFKIRMLAMKNSMPSLYKEVYNNLREMNIIEADTSPDLAEAQKNTPGEIPAYTQGDQSASDQPTMAEYGSELSAIPKPQQKNSNGEVKPLPEVRPPRAEGSPI